VSIVTAAVRAMALPHAMFAPVVSVMLASATIVPAVAADLPKDVVAVGAVYKFNVGGAGCRQRAANLKDEGRVRVALSVQGQCSCESRRRGEKVDAGREDKAAEIISGQSLSGRQRFGGVVRRQLRRLGPQQRWRRRRVPFPKTTPEESP
jgi:hypothetical protein